MARSHLCRAKMLLLLLIPCLHWQSGRKREIERDGVSTRFGMDAIIATATSTADATATTAAAFAPAATFHVAVARCCCCCCYVQFSQAVCVHLQSVPFIVLHKDELGCGFSRTSTARQRQRRRHISRLSFSLIVCQFHRTENERWNNQKIFNSKNENGFNSMRGECQPAHWRCQ